MIWKCVTDPYLIEVVGKLNASVGKKKKKKKKKTDASSGSDARHSGSDQL